MLKNIHRAVRAGVSSGGAAREQPRKHTLNNLQSHASNILTLSTAASAPSSPFSPSAAAPSRSSSPACSEESEWECLDGGREDEEMGNYFYDDEFVFGAVPSLDEVHHAFSALQQVFEPAASSHSGNGNTATSALKDTAEEIGIQASSTPSGSSDWMEPSLHICNSRMVRPYVPNRVYEAFQLMQTEPAIKRMVVSLSSDKAVWDAVLNNEAVKELRDSLKQVTVPDRAFPGSTYEESVASNGEPDDVWSWIFSNAKTKMMEVIDKVMTFINDLFQPPEGEKKASEGNTDLLDQGFRTSFFLSVLVLLIVVVSRAQKA
nr:Ran-binding protein [Ipomoea batatas]